MNKKMAAAWLICFALLLLMPGAVWAVTKDRFQTDATENTVSTEIPKLTKDNYRDYPGLVESPFNAAVPFRSQLISFSSLTDLKLFCEKSINDKVVIGSDNWLFYSMESDIDDYKGTQDNITSQNRYTYCLNNQYKYVDPSGHKSILSIIASAANSVINAVGSIFSNKKDEKKKTVKKPTTVPSKTTGAIASAVSNAVKIVNESTKAVKKVIQPVKKVKAKEPQPCPSPKSDKILDQLQFIIDVIGFLPVAGDVCDAVNALIYFARGMIISAIISIGCIVFTMVADSLLKPLKWAAGKATDLAKRILEKLPDFPKRTISYLKKVPGKIEQIPLVNKCYSTVSSLCSRLSSYIDDLFGRVSTKVAEEWSLPAKLRGTIIEEKLAKIQYAAYEHVGKLADGFFPVFDFFKNGEGISVKTIDVTLPSYEKDSAILRKVKQYASDLNDDVILRKVNNFKKGKELGDKLNEVRKVSTKRLDIYIPKGSLSRTKDIPGQIGDVLIRIFEY